MSQLKAFDDYNHLEQWLAESLDDTENVQYSVWLHPEIKPYCPNPELIHDLDMLSEQLVTANEEFANGGNKAAELSF